MGERPQMSTAIANKQLGTGLMERIGNTPLLGFERMTSTLGGVQVLAKAEWTNPGGSVKDRAARSIVSRSTAQCASMMLNEASLQMAPKSPK